MVFFLKNSYFITLFKKKKGDWLLFFCIHGGTYSTNEISLTISYYHYFFSPTTFNTPYNIFITLRNSTRIKFNTRSSCLLHYHVWKFRKFVRNIILKYRTLTFIHNYFQSVSSLMIYTIHWWYEPKILP